MERGGKPGKLKRSSNFILPVVWLQNLKCFYLGRGGPLSVWCCSCGIGPWASPDTRGLDWSAAGWGGGCSQQSPFRYCGMQADGLHFLCFAMCDSTWKLYWGNGSGSKLHMLVDLFFDLMSQLPQDLIDKIETWRNHFGLVPGKSPHALESNIVEMICFPISQTSQYELHNKYIQILDVSFFYVTRREYDLIFPIHSLRLFFQETVCQSFSSKVVLWEKPATENSSHPPNF